MLYLAISPSAINPHRCALEASTLSCLPQVGIQLGAGAISFSATACPLQSFMKKEKKKILEQSRRRKQQTPGKYKNKRRRRNTEENEHKDGKMLSEEINMASDGWHYWTKYVLETKALSPSCAFSLNYTSPPPTPSFLIKWLQLHLSIRSSPLQRLDKGLLSVAC